MALKFARGADFSWKLTRGAGLGDLRVPRGSDSAESIKKTGPKIPGLPDVFGPGFPGGLSAEADPGDHDSRRTPRKSPRYLKAGLRDLLGPRRFAPQPVSTSAAGLRVQHAEVGYAGCVSPNLPAGLRAGFGRAPIEQTPQWYPSLVLGRQNDSAVTTLLNLEKMPGHRPRNRTRFRTSD